MRSTMRFLLAIPIAFLLLREAGADVVPLATPSEFLAPVQVSEDFEGTLVGSAFEFLDPSRPPDEQPFIESAANASSGVTTSGEFGLVSYSTSLHVTLPTGTLEVGTYFGNDEDDDWRIFDGTLTAFGTDDALLGSVMVTSNGNDFVDQFIGLRASAPVSWVVLEYPREQSKGLSVFIDDFTAGIGMPVPEPDSWILLALGLLVVACSRRA